MDDADGTPTLESALLEAAKILSANYGTRDEAADAVLESIITVYTPEQFGKAFDKAFPFPEPLESWDDKAAAWAYKIAFDLLEKVDFDRDPDKIGARAWRKASGLSKREQNATALLLEFTDGSARGRAAVNTLVSLNSREMKRRDPVWLLKQALKRLHNPEAIASVERALAMESK